MTLFRSAFWPWTIGIVTVLSLIACFLFLYWASRGRRPGESGTQGIRNRTEPRSSGTADER